MNKLTLEEKTVKELQWMKDLEKTNVIKAKLKNKGYKHRLSFYGTLTEKETLKSERRRIEVYSNKEYDSRLINALYMHFLRFKTKSRFSIWLYDKTKEAICLVGSQ